MKLKVAILADFPLSALTGDVTGRGGGQGCTWLPQLALAFEDHPELDIHWVILDRGICKTASEQAFGQTFHRVPAVKFSIDLALHHWPARRALKRAIRAIQPDVVHAWGAELLYPCALQDFNGPTIFSMQGSITEYQRIGGLPDDWRWRRIARCERSYVETATVVTAESKWASERVRDHDAGADCRIVDYGIHPRFYETEWRPDPMQPAVIYIGGGGYRKGTDVLFDALRLLPERDWTVRFAGGPDLEREVSAAALPGTEYLGMLKWDDLLKEMSRAWCLAVPTRCDTGPTVVKEARVVGLPVLGTVHGGLRDYIRHGETGWIAEPLKAETVAEGLSHIMASHERARSMGLSHYQEDREVFSPRETARRFSAIYQDITAPKPTPGDIHDAPSSRPATV